MLILLVLELLTPGRFYVMFLGVSGLALWINCTAKTGESSFQNQITAFVPVQLEMEKAFSR